MPLISIIIPTYNYAQFLPEALESVFSQTFKNYEIIVVDDGSMDNTREIVGNYGERVRYFYQANSGVSAARNKGIREAEGDYLAFLDADDLYRPEFLEIMLAKIKEGYDWVGCDHIREEINTKTGEIIREVTQRQIDENWDSNELLRAFLRFDRIGSPNKILVKRDLLLNKAIFFDICLNSREDWDFCLQMAEHRCRIGWVKDALVVYRVRNDASNSTRRMGWKWLDYTFLVFKKHKEYFLRENMKQELSFHYYDLARHYFYSRNRSGKFLLCLLYAFLYGGFHPFCSTANNLFKLFPPKIHKNNV